MHFKFNVNVSEQDYLDYNIFWMIKSPYGKKQIIQFRVILLVLFGIASLYSLWQGGFSNDSLITVTSYLILLAIVQFALNPFFVWVTKAHIKSLRKNGKMGYSPISEIEFHESSFIETTPTNKTEQSYVAVERISIVSDKMIYIHVNNIMAYIIPFASFDSQEQFDDFLTFIRTKCSNIDIY